MHPTRQFETAVCGGSNLKAPMKLDFLRSLCAQERHAWPEVVLCRVEGEPLPVCCIFCPTFLKVGEKPRSGKDLIVSSETATYVR